MALILDGTNGLSDVDGSASTPAIRGTDTNTGIFFPAADTIGFAEGGAEIARFDSSGNFGIGTNSPSSFGKFVVVGPNPQMVAQGSSGAGGQIQIFSNAATSNDFRIGQGYASASDNVAYISNQATADMVFRTAASERMRLSASGNLGIGTNNPLTKLEVNGNASLTGAQPTFVGNIRITDNPTIVNATGGLEFFTSNFASGYGWKIASIDSSGVQLTFATRQNSATWSEQMRIDAGGNVGIGTSSPSNKLQVNGSLGVVDENLQFRRTGQTTWNMTNFASNLYFNNGSDRMIIDSSGNVGISVIPSAWGGFTGLQIGETGAFGSNDFGGDNTQTFISNNAYYGSGSYRYIQTGTASRYSLNANQHTWEVVGSGSANAAISWSPAMIIDGSRNVLFGTTDTNTGNGAVMFRSSGVGTYWRNATSTGGSWDHWNFYIGTTLVGRINTSGSNTSYITSSDYRLKENIAPMTGALAKVAALKPCTYIWKADGSSGEGFIAHELAEVCPSAVSGEKDAVDEEGNIKPQGIDTSFLVATLTAAIQEQQAIIQQLQADVAALKGA